MEALGKTGEDEGGRDMPRREVKPITISRRTMEIYHRRYDLGPGGTLERVPGSSMEIAHQFLKRVDPTGEETVNLFKEHYLRDKEE